MANSVKTRGIWSDLKSDLLDTKGASWTAGIWGSIEDFITSLDHADHGELVYRYLKMVGALAAPSGRDKAVVLAEGGRLINHLDPHAYDTMPPGDLIDPVEFVRRKQGNATIRKRLEGWAHDIPKRLRALQLELLRTPSAHVFNLPSAIMELAKSAKSPQSLPAGIPEMCDAIRRGQTSVAYVDQPGLGAFFWPVSPIDMPELLDAKEAVALIKRLGGRIGEKTLRDRASKRPTLRQGAQYVKTEVIQAHREGFFKHGNAAP